MVHFLHKIKGGFMAVIAFIACPCHLPFTLPVILGLAGGSVFGAWLAENTVLIYTLATIYFLGGLFLAFRWLGTKEEGISYEL